MEVSVGFYPIQVDPLIAVGRGLRLRVGSSRSGQRENIDPAPILARVGESAKTRTTQLALASSVGWFVAF